jgi:hypothetical protein
MVVGLIGRDMFIKHSEIPAFLEVLGFEVFGEKISHGLIL